jgi:hypothetical protein
MALGYSYSEWINAVAVLLQYDGTITDAASASPSSNAAFNIAYPRAIEYAEQRIYREVDLLLTRVTDRTGALTPDSRTFTLPTDQGVYVVLEQLAVFVGGVRQPPLLPMAKEALEAMWPSDTAPAAPSVPTFWCPVDQVSVLVAPAPDIAYTVECFGTQRPAPLSAANTTTFLTTYLPDLFLAGSLVWWYGFQRDFGGMSSDPQTAVSWESQFQTLLKSADVEEARKKWSSQGWTSRTPAPLATPPQT